MPHARPTGVTTRARRSAAALIAVLLTASCDGDSPTTNGSTVADRSVAAAQTTADAGLPVATLVTAPPSDAWPAALITGPLTLEDGCFFVDATEGGRGVAVFEHGTTFDPVSASVVSPDGTGVPLGSTIEASGGGNEVAASSDADLAACAERAGLDRYVLVAGMTVVATP